MATPATAEGDPATFDIGTASTDDLRNQLASSPDQVRDGDGVVSTTPPAEEGEPPAPEPEPESTSEPEPESTSEPEPEPTSEPEPESTSEPEPESTSEPEPESTSEPEPPQETEAEKLAKMRIRPRAKEDQMVIDLYRSEGFEGTFQDAVDVIYGRQSRQTQEPARDQPAEPAEPEVPAELTQLRTEISDLEKQLEKATDEFDAAEALKTQRELFRKELAAKTIEDRLEAQKQERLRTETDTRRQLAAESRNRAVDKYPVLKNRDSLERRQFDAFLNEAQADPNQAPIFQSPLWPEIMAERFAAAHKLSPAAPAKPAAAPARPAGSASRPPTGTRTKQVSAGQKTGDPPTQVTKESLRRDLPSLKKGDLFSMLGSSK